MRGIPHHGISCVLPFIKEGLYFLTKREMLEESLTSLQIFEKSVLLFREARLFDEEQRSFEKINKNLDCQQTKQSMQWRAEYKLWTKELKQSFKRRTKSNSGNPGQIQIYLP